MNVREAAVVTSTIEGLPPPPASRILAGRAGVVISERTVSAARRKAAGAALLVASLSPAVASASAGTGDPPPEVRFAAGDELDGRLQAVLQVLYAVRDDVRPGGGPPPPDDVSIHRFWVTLSGTLHERFGYKLRVGMHDEPNLLDAAASVLLVPGKLRLDAGQFFVPFSREAMTYAAKLETVQIAQAVRHVAAMRDRGIALRSDLGAGTLDVGVFNGTGKNVPDDNDDKDVLVRGTLAPWGWVSVGGAFMAGRQGRGADAATRWRMGGHLLLRAGGAQLSGEMLAKREAPAAAEPTWGRGYFVQAAYRHDLNARGAALQPLVRYERFDPDTGAGRDEVVLLTVGLNAFLHDERVELQIDWVRALEDERRAVGHAFYAQGQLSF